MDLSRQTLEKVVDCLAKTTHRKQNADEEMALAAAKLVELRLQREAANHEHEHAVEDDAHCIYEHVHELIDALEATPSGKTTRSYAAVNAVRTIVCGMKGQECMSVASDADMSDGINSDGSQEEGGVHSEDTLSQESLSASRSPTPPRSSPSP